MIRLFLATVLLVSQVHAAELRFLTTNFENLFDATHDEGKQDYTYLPVAVKQAMPAAMEYCNSRTSDFYKQECLTLDWTQAVVDRKVQRIVEVMKNSMAPNLPDVITVEEVENISVLDKVAKGLGKDYKAILIEGEDERGIDTAIITRLQVLSTKLHPINTGANHGTRGILEARLKSGRKVLTVFGNHWPSQSNPDQHRMAAGELLASLARVAQKDSDLVIAGGDFNTAADDELNALKTYIEPLFYDVEPEARKQGARLAAAATYSFRGNWASLDHIFVLKKGSQTPNFSKTQIYTEGGKLIEEYDFRGKTESRPVRYNTTTGAGFSDHLPLAVTLDW